MSGIGPVEPGEGTHVQEPPAAPPATAAGLRRRRRRALLGAAAALALLAGAGALYTARRAAPEPPPAPPYPAQAVDLVFLNGVTTPPGVPPGGSSFAVALSVESGPPVTVTRLAQPYDGLSLTASPKPPFRTAPHAARKITITLRVTDCGKAPRNPGLPFLDVTLRNSRAIQDQSFLLGPRYARYLDHILQVACGNDSK
ncbi:Tat pathway signal sequence domain protein [Streptomyces sp. NPDC048182]|uniref:Tat pathway signal sequence domain protein n=1 Tax=Streptomyces sp. NPDC048182 TaxID=3365507 RepID=UPI0037219561